jgi:2,3-bisphosphoglycerate-dependent phosphoglycerate mutase/probable phosphoglycerate mutase
LILRHGESEWNAAGRWQGWLDIALTPRGEQQAAVRARALAHDSFAPRVIYTSDLIRAARTAEIIAAHVGAPVIADAGLRERNGGEWQGCTGAEIDERWPGMRAAWRHGALAAPPGGEHDDQVLERFDAALTRALAHAGPSVVAIVTHHGLLRLVATRAGADVHTLIPNLGGYWFDVVDGRVAAPVALDTLPEEAERPAVE